MAGNEKRERQRQNRTAAQSARMEAAQAVRKRKSRIRAAVLGTLVVLLAVFAAVISSRGDDDKKDVAAGDSPSTTAAGSTGSSVTTESPPTTVAPSTTATTAVGAGASTTSTVKATEVTCNDTKPPKAGNGKTYDKAPAMSIDPAKKYTATIETSCGTMRVEFDPKGAPKTVNNFVFLAREGFYDGLTFHRMLTDFVIQGGDPKGDGTGGPGYQFEDELPKDGYEIGSLAMANSGADTNGSQFFVITGEKGAALPNQYSRFGKVTEGVEVAQKIESFATPGDADGKPTRPLYMLKVEITESAG